MSEQTHVFRAAVIWEVDGDRFFHTLKPVLTKGAATQSALRHRKQHESRSRTFVGYIVERSLLAWHVIENSLDASG